MPEESLDPSKQNSSQNPLPSLDKKGINWTHTLIGVAVGIALSAMFVLVYTTVLGVDVFKEIDRWEAEYKAYQEQIEKESTPSAQEDETGGWSTHTNTPLKYSIKYPNTFFLYSNKIIKGWDVKGDILSSKNLKNTNDLSYSEVPSVVVIIGTTAENCSGIPSDEVKLTDVCVEERFTTTSGVKITKVTDYYNDKSGVSLYTFEGAKSYPNNINIYGYNVKEYEDLFDKIVSTFKFLD